MSDSPQKQTAIWPLKWIRDEAFWKGITSQIIATGTVALVVFLWASAAGYLDPKGSHASFRAGMFVVGVVLFIIGAMLTAIGVTSVRWGARNYPRRVAIIYGLVISLLLTLPMALVAVPWFIAIVNDGPLNK